MTTQTENKKIRVGGRPTAATVLVLCALLCILTYLVWQNAVIDPKVENLEASPNPNPITTPTPDNTADPNETPESPDLSLPEFNPGSVEQTLPSRLIKSTDVSLDTVLAPGHQLSSPIDFGFGADYTDVEGIVTFRGNNFRDTASYGTANVSLGKLVNAWSVQTSSLQAPSGDVWTGSGWVGQPLMMTWPKDLRQHMNMYDWAKAADKITEVIYATMDGNIYFIDLESGKKTRDDMRLGYTFKGSGALDPRGYPIMYLGSGYDSAKGKSHAFIINLLDCSVMYEFGQVDSFSLRGSLSFFDGSALVDAETDQLIYPGENGILYIMKLNTAYDPAAGSLTIAPSEVVRWRYNGTRSSTGSYWLGMEDSPIIWRGHIIMSDNGGNLMCLDLNTLQLKWVQDVLDDTNCTPVLELEDGHPYVYTSTSFHGGWRAPMDGTATIPIWKIDGLTGEIVWQKDYTCYTADGVSGGTQGTLALGKNGLSDLIFVPVAKTPGRSSGILTALNKKTGEVVWEKETQMYAWSSPVCVYDDAGRGYIVFCTAGGYMYLLDGLTGDVIDHLEYGANFEASPAVYNDTIVIGSRSQQIHGVKIT